MKRVILLLVDGLRPDVGEAALGRGELPHLQRMVGRHGIGRGVTVFPSTTTVAYLPLLTGCMPGRCNIPSIRWLNPRRYRGRWWRDRDLIRSYCGYQAGRLDADLATNIRTIFELIPESLGLFTPVARGLPPGRDPSRTARRFWGVVSHATGWHQPSDDVVSRHLLSGVEEGWRFIFAQFPAVDGYTHQSLPDGPKVRDALRRVDETVGRLRAALTRRGELQRTLVLVVSDHGASVVHQHLDLADWFRAHGVRTLSHPIVWTRDPRAAVMVAGNGSAMVYAGPGQPRRRRWSLARLRRPDAFGSGRDLVAALTREPAVAFVAAEEAPGTVRLADASGEAAILRDGDLIRYQPEAGDPLALGEELALSPKAWLEASWESAYPDGPVQLLDQFRASRTGDLLVIAREGFDLRRRFEFPEHRSGHGSLIRAHMQVPVWASVPVPPGPIRTVDLFPAMLNWLGLPRPEGIDGRLTWRPGRSAPVAEPVRAGEFCAPDAG